MRSSLSGSGPRELASKVAVPEREENVVSAVEVTMVGLISVYSGANSVTEWPISLNSIATDTGDDCHGIRFRWTNRRGNSVTSSLYLFLVAW